MVKYIFYRVRDQRSRWKYLLLVDSAKKLADGDQLMWKQTVLVRGG
jgi:hypothetical protein